MHFRTNFDLGPPKEISMYFKKTRENCWIPSRTCSIDCLKKKDSVYKHKINTTSLIESRVNELNKKKYNMEKILSYYYGFDYLLDFGGTGKTLLSSLLISGFGEVLLLGA